MKISNLYIGVIERVYQNDFGRMCPVISSLPERMTVLHKENDSNYLEDLKYGGSYPVGLQQNIGIGQSFIQPRSLTPMFEINDDSKDKEIEKEKVLIIFNSTYQRGE